MADVTISELNKGIPAGNALLPYSQGGNTLAVAASAILQNAGNIGIGTANPQCAIEVRGDGTHGAGRIRISNSTDPAYEISDTTNVKGYLFYDTIGASNSIILRHASVLNQLVLKNTGNVGIGTTAPAEKLTVVGNISASGDVKATGYRIGSLPMFGANAFVHFNGGQDVNGNASTDNTTRRIYAGGNVSSVLRNTTGLYTIYFTTAMTSTEYLAVCSTRHLDGTTWDVHCEVSNRLTTSCVVNIQSNYAGSPGSTAYDPRNVDVMIIC